MPATKTKKEVTNLQPVIKELHKAYGMINKILFNNELPEVVITMQSRGNKMPGVLGWFVTSPIWENGEGKTLYEINIVPEAMKRDYIEIIQTLAHEAVHVYCAVNKIKETSRGGSYHNKRFKQVAEEHGFEFLHDGPDSKIGYSMITFTPKTAGMIKCWNIDQDAFKIARLEYGGPAKDKKKSNIIKWVCPCCGDIVRSSKPDMFIKCFRPNENGEPCDVFFKPEIKDEELGE